MPMIGRVQALVEDKWQTMKVARPLGMLWSARLSPPIPLEWPNKGRGLVFYAFARGLSLRDLRDGEYVGRVWSKVTVNPELGFEWVTKTLVVTEEVVGVRPLTSQEIEVLNVDPVQLLGQQSAENDKKIRAFYCLNKYLGNLPQEAVVAHPAFFRWLSCQEEQRAIGTATMNADRSIDLMLRAEGAGGTTGDSLEKLKVGDKEYEMVLRHVGGLRPGESKPVPPWPEQ